MAFEFILFSSLSYIFWGIAIAFSAGQDVLEFKYEKSIFSSFKSGSFLDWYFQPTKKTWKRKYEEVYTKKRKKIWIFTIPAAFFDAWHGMKLVKQLFTFASMIMCALSGTTWVYYKVYSHESDIIWAWHIIIGALIGFMFITHTFHSLFFNKILIKEDL